MKFFNKRKKHENNEPVKLPLEMEIYKLLSNNSGDPPRRISFSSFQQKLEIIPEGLLLSLCNGTTEYNATILLTADFTDPESKRDQIHEKTAMEVLQYPYKSSFIDELLWSLSEQEIWTSASGDFFISIGKGEETTHSPGSLEIKNSREFSFGKILISEITEKSFPVSVTFETLSFTEDRETPEDQSIQYFESTMEIDNSEHQFYYLIKQKSRLTASVVKTMIGLQKIKFEKIFGVPVSIKKAGPIESLPQKKQSDFTLSGMMLTMTAQFPYKLIFPKKFLTLFPEYICTTVKGKILQINKEYFRKDFDSFHQSGGRFLFSDYISIIDKRDLNLICQNFFLSNSMGGDEIRNLLFYKVKQGDRTGICRVPLTAGKEFLNHLPVRLRERFEQSGSCSRNYDDLLNYSENILQKIYADFNEGKILLSHKSRYILDRELGSKVKENKTRRLRKLIGDKRYINALRRIDSKKVQVLFSNMQNVLIVDTFIYQADEIVKLKPYFSSRRFRELREDINFTRVKIKSNQIDINRICDSIEKFNRYIRDFISKERKEGSSKKAAP